MNGFNQAEQDYGDKVRYQRVKESQTAPCVDNYIAPVQPFIPDGKGCPHCGYCPHCGRTNPTYPSYPQYPPYRYEVTCGQQTGALSGTLSKS